MQQIPSIDEIKLRAAALRISMEELARLAKVAGSTPRRMVAGKHESRISTRIKLHRALELEENKLSAHLHGLPGAGSKAA